MNIFNFFLMNIILLNLFHWSKIFFVYSGYGSSSFTSYSFDNFYNEVGESICKVFVAAEACLELNLLL